MDIEKFIKRECDNDSNKTHAEAYEKEIRRSFKQFGHITDVNEIKYQLDKARIRYSKGFSLHEDVADCMVLYELLKEANQRMGTANN